MSAHTAHAPSAPHPDLDQLLTVADVAGNIGAHESTVRLWIKRGELKAYKFDTRIGWRIKRRDYEEFLNRRRLTSAISRQLMSAASAVTDSLISNR
jgi:excisionase family DNA binding protein